MSKTKSLTSKTKSLASKTKRLASKTKSLVGQTKSLASKTKSLAGQTKSLAGLRIFLEKCKKNALRKKHTNKNIKLELPIPELVYLAYLVGYG